MPWEEEFVVVQGTSLSLAIGVVAFAMGLCATMASWRVRKIHPAHYLLGGLVMWIVSSYLWSRSLDATIVKARSSVQLLLMTWLIWEFAPTRKRLQALLAAYVLGSYVSAVSVLYAFVTNSGSNLGIVEGRYTAAGFDENELGVTLALAVVMSGYLLALDQGYRFLWLIHIPVAVLAICLTGSRGAFITTCIAIAIVPCSFASFTTRVKWMVVLGIIILCSAAIIVIPHGSWDRIGTIHNEVAEGTLTNRTRIWAAGLEVYREHPLLGVGSGAFGDSVYSRLDIPYVAHNSYLSILVELGTVGATLFAAVLGTLMYLITTLSRLQRRAWFVLLATWCVAVSSLTWEHRKPTWFLFGLLISESAAIRSRSNRPQADLTSGGLLAPT